MKYRFIVRLANEIAQLEESVNETAKDGYSFLSLYESNARIIVVMELAPKAGRPKKIVESDN